MTFRTIFGYSSRACVDRHSLVTYKPAPCAWCKATGRHPFSLFTRCDVCHGQGSTLVIEPHRKCAWCGGSGRKLALFKCSACNGSGWAHDQIE
jgi:DnaJ-class molecular chaperone